MHRNCPYCREPIPVQERDKKQCPHCGSDFFASASKQLEINYDLMMKKGLIIAVCLLLAMQVMLPVSPMIGMVILVAHAIATRVYLVRVPRQLMSPMRRFFIRWVPRMGFLSLGIPGYCAFSPMPTIGIVFGIVTYVFLTVLVKSYVTYCLKREREQLPLAWWESFILLIFASAIFSIIAVAWLAGLIVKLCTRLIPWLGQAVSGLFS